MDSNVALVLNNLAEKLGTTAEHLFGILVRQAHIDGIVTTVQYVTLILFWVSVYKILRNFASVREWTEHNDAEPLLFIGGLLVTISFLIFTIAAFCYLPTYAASFFNPEYWALHEILSAIKSK